MFKFLFSHLRLLYLILNIIPKNIQAIKRKITFLCVSIVYEYLSLQSCLKKWVYFILSPSREKQVHQCYDKWQTFSLKELNGSQTCRCEV